MYNGSAFLHVPERSRKVSEYRSIIASENELTMMPSFAVHVRYSALIFFLVMTWSAVTHAQDITAAQYVTQCRAHTDAGNEIAARAACEGALQLDPTLDTAGRLLAELDMRAGNLSAARTRLINMQRQRPHSDTLVLLAGIAVLQQQPKLLEQYLTRLSQLPPPTDTHAVPFLEAQLHLLRGEYTEAVHDMLHALSTS